MSSAPPLSVGCPTAYNVSTSATSFNQNLATANAIINLTYSGTANASFTLALSSIKYPSLITLNVTSSSVAILLTIYSNASQSNIITAQSIQPSDQIIITYSSSSSSPPSVSIGAQSLYNHLIKDFIPSGQAPSAATNPLITNSQLTAELPSALSPLLDDDGETPLGLANKLVTTSNLAADLTPYLPTGNLLTNTNNKLVTTQGNANLMTTFFGTLSTNPGILSAMASGIIANNNLTSIDIINDIPFSLIQSIVIPAANSNAATNFELYADSNPLSSPLANVNDIKISENAILTIVADFKTALPSMASAQIPLVSVVGNLLGSPISTSNATNIIYGLINGSFFTNSFTSTYVDANGDPVAPPSGATPPSLVINLNDQSSNTSYSTGGSARTAITSANIRFSMSPTVPPTTPPTTSAVPVNITFPCNAYGKITSINNSNNTTTVSNTSPPVIIDAMLPLFNELAVASGLVFSNAIGELESLLQSLNNGYGNLSALTNYLQSHSENIHVVGKYESAIAINGNSLPIGYTYYNGSTSIIGNNATTPLTTISITQPASGIWTSDNYSPVSSTNTYTLTGTTTPTSINLSSTSAADFVGLNSSQGLILYDETGIPKSGIVYPMTNTIIVPSSYVGFGQISALPTGNCYPFPPYQLTINLNYINTGIVYPPPTSPPDTTAPYPSTDYSNGSQIQPGTMLKIYNESNYVVRVIARNCVYTGITNTTQLPNLKPVPMEPFTTYYDASLSTPTNPTVNTSVPAPTSGWPRTSTSTTPYVNPSPNPSTYSINLRDTTSDVIYVKAKDSITLVFSTSNTTSGSPGSWGYI